MTVKPRSCGLRLLSALLGLTCLFSAHAADPDLKRVGSWPGFVRGAALSVAVAGNHAYVVEGAQLSIFDISEPTNPRRLGGYSVFGLAVAPLQLPPDLCLRADSGIWRAAAVRSWSTQS